MARTDSEDRAQPHRQKSDAEPRDAGTRTVVEKVPVTATISAPTKTSSHAVPDSRHSSKDTASVRALKDGCFRVAMVIQRFRPMFSGQGEQLELLCQVLARRGLEATIITCGH